MKTTAFTAQSRRRALPLSSGIARMLMMAFAFSASAYAANDNLREALLLDVGGRVSIDVTNYTREPGEPGDGNTNNRTAWFVWTAPGGTPTTVRFSTYGSSRDTVINLFKRDPAKPELLVTSLVPATTENPVIVDNDATLGVNTGYLEWTPEAGTTYYISVGRNGNGGGGGTVVEATFAGVVAADGIAQLIPNDDFANALEFTATIPPGVGQVPRGALVAGTTIGATGESGEDTILNASDPEGGTVWYKYTTGGVAEVFSVEVNGIPPQVSGDAILQAFTYTGAPAIATLVFDEEDDSSSMVETPRLVINAAANTEYYFRVTSTDGDGFNFNIRLDFNPLQPANDEIGAAIDLGSTLPIARNEGEDIYSATTTDLTGFNGDTSGNNVWYRWTAPSNGLVRLRSIAPTATATTGNFHPDGSTFLFDAEVYYDAANPTDLDFDPNTRQAVQGFDEGDPQTLTFYAHKDVVYFIEIGGDNDINSAGRGFFAFVLEDLHVSDIARTGVSYGPEGVLKTIQPPVVNLNGDVAFQASLELGGPVTPNLDTGLFLFNGTTQVSVVEGEQEYGTPLDIDGDGVSDDKVVFSTFSNLFLADRNPANNNQPDLGFNAALVGKSDDEPLGKNNNRGFYHDDPANPGVTEVRTNDYLNDSFTWEDGAAFLGSFNTPVRETVENTALFTGKMVGIPAVRDTGIFASSPNVVIQEEDPAPNTADGVEFGDVTGTPTVNSLDAMAFRTTLRGDGVTSKNDSALYTVVDYNAAPTALNYRLRLREGDDIAGLGNLPLLGGATIATVGEPRINGNGKIAVLANLAIGSGSPVIAKTGDTAILSDLLTSDYSFAVVAREGDIARDEKGAEISGVKFASFVSPVLITNNAVVFTAKIAGTGVNAKNNTGIWLWDGASTYQVARTGGTALGLIPSGPTFKTLGPPLANPAGRVAFTASLAGAGVTASNDTGLWTVSEDGVLALLKLREGDVYDFGVVELPIRRTITAISLTSGSGGDDGFARGIDQNGAVAVTTNLSKGKTKSGQAVFKIAP
ncbi:MAG TPA: choice-of-anchor tandem repeat NxxGxxAF-containing protein [Chthoniobacteraceae bacterium]|nr:choice-of-anchor tandem repeat NxxGxxAF-containing protein [Chthoniobacteraceae bacterium]